MSKRNSLPLPTLSRPNNDDGPRRKLLCSPVSRGKTNFGDVPKIDSNSAGDAPTFQNQEIEFSNELQTSSNDDLTVDGTANTTLVKYQGISLLQSDVLHLDQGQMLNDTIVDFWLQHIIHKILSPIDRNRTYVFPSFFYKRLTSSRRMMANGDDGDATQSASERRHNRVKRWTKNVDIFDKDFLIVPIRERSSYSVSVNGESPVDCNWFLAVICFPGLKGVHDMVTGEPLPDHENLNRGKTETENGGEDYENGNKEVLPSRKIKKPCILVLDSLAIEPRGRVYSTLREYLRMEYKTRKGEEREFTKTSMPGAMPRVPQQPNHFDCGIYVLFFTELFFSCQITSYDDLATLHKMWRHSSCATKREEIYKSIVYLVFQSNPEAMSQIPRLSFTY